MKNNSNQLPQQRRDGQILSTNYSSSDNPLKYQNTQSSYSNYNTNSNSYNNYFSGSESSNYQRYPINRAESTSQQYTSSNTPVNKSMYANEIPQSQTPQYGQAQPYNQVNSQYNAEQYSQSQPNLYQSYGASPRPPKKDSEIRVDMENVSKQAYKRALDQQVAEKQVNRFVEEKERKQNELAMIPQYPFGRRTNPSFLVENNYPPSQNYVPSSYNYYGRPSYENVDSYGPHDGTPKLDKDRIVEKPNSLNDDVPPYDPVKESKALMTGNVYDPWGKPGGGAPLVDPDTGRKYTKISGQLKYDTIGLTPSARQRYRESSLRHQNASIEEQKQEIELEQQRRKQEDTMHRARAGDVATWIQDIEGARWPLRTHLNHTNVTRDKVNLEYARRGVNDKTRIYHDELGLQLEERERQNKLHKLREDVAGIEHTRHWNDWWGKPGGGAPTIDRRRHEINETLESPRFHWEQNTSSEAVSNSTGTSLILNNSRAVANQLAAGNLLFTKGTLRSNHKNHYENVQQMK